MHSYTGKYILNQKKKVNIMTTASVGTWEMLFFIFCISICLSVTFCFFDIF